MKCKLCLKNEAKKKNTHYLTDSIIRLALNEEGSNTREKGLYFDVSNNEEGIKFNFQRNTNSEKIIEEIKRELSEEELVSAKVIPYSVDFIFCSHCEEIFTKIETLFIANQLEKFRNNDLDDIEDIIIKEAEITRLFFILQVWRTAESVDSFYIDVTLMEIMRLAILNYPNHDLNQLKSIPLLVTYLQTKGGEFNYTQNLVGHSSGMCPSIILMNDFVIQFFNNEASICYNELHGLNDEEKYHNYINLNESEFKIQILKDKQRIDFNVKFMMESKFEPLINMCKNNFQLLYFLKFRKYPSSELIQECIKYLVNSDVSLIEKYTNMQLKNKTIEFIKLIDTN